MKNLNSEKMGILFTEIQKELKNQYDKFGYQKHTLERWFLILMEEISEIAKSINDLYNSNDFDKQYLEYKQEIIQSITLLTHLYFRPYSIKFNQMKKVIELI